MTSSFASLADAEDGEDVAAWVVTEVLLTKAVSRVRAIGDPTNGADIAAADGGAISRFSECAARSLCANIFIS